MVAMATELENRGCQIQDSLWSAKILAENPEMIRNVHYDYFKAGAGLCYYCKLSGYNKWFCGKRLLQGRGNLPYPEFCLNLQRTLETNFWANPGNRVGRPTPLVGRLCRALWCIFSGWFQNYRGHYGLTMEELMEFHRPRIQLLVDAGADILACETFPCLIEAQAITALLKEFPGVYCWISF